MIYDVLLNKLNVTFVTEIKLGNDITLAIFKGEDYRYSVEITPNDTNKVTLISIEEKVTDNKWVKCDGVVPLDDCLQDLAYILSLTGAKSFIYKGRAHSINIVLQNSQEYIYTQEYSENLKRSVVYRHPKLGSVFTLAPDEVTYVPVDTETHRAVTEQAVRLNMSVGIPETWLIRTIDEEGGFKYHSLREVYSKKQ